MRSKCTVSRQYSRD